MNPKELTQALGQVIHDHGYTVRIGERDDRDRQFCKEGLRGQTDHMNRTVTIAVLPEWDTVQVLGHELGHVLLHSPWEPRDYMGIPSYALPVPIAEFEAELTSLAVRQHYGCGNKAWSKNYLAGYAYHLTQAGSESIMREALDRAFDTAVETRDQIVREIEAPSLKKAA
jgi:hypothetical protein